MPLVAVAANTRSFGVDCDADDWRHPQGSDRNGRRIMRGDRCVQEGIAAAYEVQDLTNALAGEYKTDAHLVPYILRDPRGGSSLRQPRLNKAGLAFVLSLGWTVEVECLFADIDNPGHCAWTDELREAARLLDRKLATAGVYYSAHGRRLVQPLTRSVVVDDSALVEHIHAAWLRELSALGYHPDEGCQDWTRHYRLPHVRRNGRFSRSELVDLSRMRPVDPPAPAPLLGRAKRKAAHTVELSRAAPVSEAALLKAFEAAGWLGPSLGRDKRAVRCPFAANHSIGREFDSSTVLFGATPRWPAGYIHCSHAHCSGRPQEQFLAALPDFARALVPRVESPKRVRSVVTKDDAKLALESAFRKAPDGLSVVIAGCGTGKTEAALTVALERSEKERRSESKRAPLHSQTAISVPTTKLAVEVVNRLRTRGAAVRRIFGPLSVLAPSGEPECRIHECARAFSSGGLSVPWELCEGRGKEPCDHAEVCQARGGTEGPEDARIVVGPHALLSRLQGCVGKTGLLVVDEPPALLAHEVLEADQLTECAGELARYFENRYAVVMRPALLALASWVQSGPLDSPRPLSVGLVGADGYLLSLALEQTGADSLLEAVKMAHEPTADGEPPKVTSPPVQRQFAYAARRSLGIALAVGRASKVARVVWVALTAEHGSAIARLEERAGRRVLVVTLPDQQLHAALTREGQVVVADAGGHQNLEVYQRIVGYSPQTVEVYAEETAAVSRTWIERRASRAGWMHHGRLEVDGSLVRSVELAVAWLCEKPVGRAALVTFQTVELVLRAALGEDVAADWARLKQTASDLPEAKAKLVPILSRLPCRLDLGHFGAVRGLDHWKGHDALVTLGDPWGQLGDARWEGEFLRLADWEGRFAEAARHELEQAHGRLRVVHRTTAARALHVGLVAPGGWDLASVDVRADGGGRPRLARRDEVAGLVGQDGIKAAARTLGVSRNTVRRYLAAGGGVKNPLYTDHMEGVFDPGSSFTRVKNSL